MIQKEFILAQIPEDELMAGLAEEATELAHAALKYRRASTGINPTPTSIVDAQVAVMEEVADVLLYLGVLGLIKVVETPEDVEHFVKEKAERWVWRLERKDNEQHEI